MTQKPIQLTEYDLEDGEIQEIVLLNEAPKKQIKTNKKQDQHKYSSSSSSSSSSQSQCIFLLFLQLKLLKFKKEEQKSRSATPQKQQKTLCLLFVNSSCKLGKKCSLSHNIKNYLCAELNFFGECERGNACPFKHEKTDNQLKLIKCYSNNTQQIISLIGKGKKLIVSKKIQKMINKDIKNKKEVIEVLDSESEKVRHEQKLIDEKY